MPWLITRTSMSCWSIVGMHLVVTGRRSTPFVRLHQASLFYGVASSVLGDGAVQQAGPQAGLQGRATADEIRTYYAEVLAHHPVGSGSVTFLGGHEHQQDGARVITVNELVSVADAPGQYVITGSGKTATDAVVWLLLAGLGPDRIVWVRPREPPCCHGRIGSIDAPQQSRLPSGRRAARNRMPPLTVRSLARRTALRDRAYPLRRARLRSADRHRHNRRVVAIGGVGSTRHSKEELRALTSAQVWHSPGVAVSLGRCAVQGR